MVGKKETLLSPSGVKLYGRIIAGINVDLSDARDELGKNKFLREQLDPSLYDDDMKPAFARIYGFTYLGRYTSLSRATIFLVHGKGDLASPRAALVRTDGSFTIDTDPEGKPSDESARLATGASSTDLSGVAAKEWEFSSDIRVWEYDRADFSLRLDVDSGPLERILIEREERGDEMPYFRGQRTRLRGPDE